MKTNGEHMEYGISKETGLNFEQAIERVTEELKNEGFGILTTIDLKETLKNKIDADIDKYTILGACNPSFAYRGIQAEQELGLLLPCNVIVYEKEGKVYVSAMNPELMTSVTENPELSEMAKEVKGILEIALSRV
jgi:uncharacterized protein (DUF302 family)